MNRIVFILPYFGKFNNYFQLFLNSCKWNDDLCDWYIFTDDRRDFCYPSNVKVQYMDFHIIQTRIREKFNFNVQIERPYKLCDYRPAYGYIFEEYLTEYSHWGYCDVDLIFGKLSCFLKMDILDSYEKIFNLGHCTIYKNSYLNNRRFMGNYNGIKRYREVFLSERNCSFDEEYNKSINNIYEQYGIDIFSKSYAANIYTKSSDFRLCFLNHADKKYYIEKRKRALFIWQEGHLIREQLYDQKINQKEYMYIHLQSRPMKVRVSEKVLCYKIIPNAFECLEIMREEIDPKTFNTIKVKNFNLHYFRLRIKNLLTKLRLKISAVG